MNDHEIFVASFDYHYALRKLNELGGLCSLGHSSCTWATKFCEARIFHLVPYG